LIVLFFLLYHIKKVVDIENKTWITMKNQFDSSHSIFYIKNGVLVKTLQDC